MCISACLCTAIAVELFGSPERHRARLLWWLGHAETPSGRLRNAVGTAVYVSFGGHETDPAAYAIAEVEMYGIQEDAQISRFGLPEPGCARGE